MKDPVEAWADMEEMVRSGVAKARGGEEESIQVNTRLIVTLKEEPIVLTTVVLSWFVPL